MVDSSNLKSLSVLLNKPNIISSFDCQHVTSEGMLIPG